MISHFATESFFHRVCILDMIYMAMRDQEKIGAASGFLQPFAGSSRSIEKDQAVRGGNEVSIGFEDTANKGLKVDHIEGNWVQGWLWRPQKSCSVNLLSICTRSRNENFPIPCHHPNHCIG